MQPLIEILESSEVLMRFDRERARSNGYLKFTSVQMISIITYIEIKKLTYDSYETAIKGRGGQIILKNLGMPVDPDGRRLALSRGWISTFRNHEYSVFRFDLEREMQDSIPEQTQLSPEQIVYRGPTAIGGYLTLFSGIARPLPYH